jgi:hypothetical protein
MLMMILRRQSMPLRDTYLITTPSAPVDARVLRFAAGGVAVIELLMRIVLEELLVFI